MAIRPNLAPSTSRSRARPRQGERTTLRIPRALEPAIRRLVDERGLSRNEALIALAERGAEAEARERRLVEERERIASAVLAGEPSGPFPTVQEFVEAVAEGRGARG